MIIGYDGGYGNIKTSEGVIFQSKMSLFDRSLDRNSNSLEVEYEGRKFIVGKGSYETDLNKITKESSKIFMLTALALSGKERDFKVVAGLPIQQYKKQMVDLKRELLSYSGSVITVAQHKRTLIVDDVSIFPQCVAAYYSLSSKQLKELGKSDVIIVDIGARTVDIALLSYEGNSRKRSVEKYSTINEGTLSLYSDFVSEINLKLDLDYRVEDADKILRNGIYVKGVQKDLKFTKDVIYTHANEISKELDLNYPVKTGSMLLVGGGSLLIGGILRKRYKSIIVEQAQFSNANGLREVGKQLWQR